eukprot:1179908-Prorocentrum_minimum.AAC.5
MCVAGRYLKAGALHVEIDGCDRAGGGGEVSANTAIVQQFFQLPKDDEKRSKLVQMLEGMPEGGKMIVFVNTKRRCQP